MFWKHTKDERAEDERWSYKYRYASMLSMHVVSPKVAEDELADERGPRAPSQKYELLLLLLLL